MERYGFRARDVAGPEEQSDETGSEYNPGKGSPKKGGVTRAAASKK